MQNERRIPVEADGGAPMTGVTETWQAAPADGQFAGATDGHDVGLPERLKDPEHRPEDPEIRAVIQLHSAMVAARKSEADPLAQEELAEAWAGVYAIMPPATPVDVVEPNVPPATEVGMRRLGEKLYALDSELRGPLSKILGLAMAATHPDALRLKGPADDTLKRTIGLLAMAHDRLEMLHEQSRNKSE